MGRCCVLSLGGRSGLAWTHTVVVQTEINGGICKVFWRSTERTCQPTGCVGLG